MLLHTAHLLRCICQTQRRPRREDMGVSGNYMPLSAHMFVQSNDARLTWLTDTALGGTSHKPVSCVCSSLRGKSLPEGLLTGEHGDYA